MYWRGIKQFYVPQHVLVQQVEWVIPAFLPSCSASPHCGNNNKPFNGRLSGTTRVGWYQKKHSPAHTHPGQRLSPFSICNGPRHPLYSAYVHDSPLEQPFSRSSFGLPLGLEPSTSSPHCGWHSIPIPRKAEFSWWLVVYQDYKHVWRWSFILVLTGSDSVYMPNIITTLICVVMCGWQEGHPACK